MTRIQGISICKRCKGSLVDAKTGEPCTACLDPEFGWPTGIDPQSFTGCCGNSEECEDNNGHAVITIGTG